MFYSFILSYSLAYLCGNKYKKLGNHIYSNEFIIIVPYLCLFLIFRKQYRPTCYWSWKIETADIVENQKVNERMILNELHLQSSTCKCRSFP